jgi:maltose 6'-phosphate phosphatase
MNTKTNSIVCKLILSYLVALTTATFGCSNAQGGPERIDPTLTPADLVLELDPGPQPELPEGLRLRAASLNVHGGQDAEATQIGEFFAGQNLDLIGLQECPADLIESIAQAAGFEHFAGDGVGILSHTALEDVARVNLQSGRSFVHAQTQIDGLQFSVYTAHLGWNLDGDRQCREFVDEHLAHDPIPHLVIMGDFNDEHLSSQNTILEEVLSDVFTTMNWYPGERISWPATLFDGSEGSQLIDLVFYRSSYPAIVIDAEVYNLSPVLSDHKPVLAELLYPRDPQQTWTSDPFAEIRDPLAGWPPQSQLPANLLINPGAEEGISGWTVSGDAQAVETRENQSAFSGNRMFTGYKEQQESKTRLSMGSQTVDLSESTTAIDERMTVLYASGQMATGYLTESDGQITSNKPIPYDDGEVIVEALAADGRVLASKSSKRRDTLRWHPFAIALPVPALARQARLTWISHRKVFGGESNDAVFDDLYLGQAPLSEPHAWLSGNLLADPGAETGQADDWEKEGWQVLGDLVPFGINIYAPWSFSGGFMFQAGGLPGISGGPQGTCSLAQRVAVDHLFEQEVPGKQVALRWGGRVRTWAAGCSIKLTLEIYDTDGSLWGTLEAEPVHAAEWTLVEQRTRIPKGASAVRLVVETQVSEIDTGAFGDEFFLLPEIVSSAN